MAVSTRLNAPNYKIFEPDALDAAYAKGNLDPIMGGISYAFGSAYKQEKAGYQDKYLDSQEKFNRMAATLDAMEMDQKTKQEAMKLGIGLIKDGEDPTKILGAGMVYANPADSSLPALKRGELQASINQKNASASASGNEGKSTYTESWTDPASGKDYVVKRQGTPSTIGPPPVKGGGVNPPAGSTAIPSKAGTVAPEQIRARAEAIAGRGAVIVDTRSDGATLWKGPKGMAAAKSNGRVEPFNP